jgi:hypothetical protein
VDALAVPVMVGIPNPLAFRLRFPISPPPWRPAARPSAEGSAGRSLGARASRGRVRVCRSVSKAEVTDADDSRSTRWARPISITRRGPRA